MSRFCLVIGGHVDHGKSTLIGRLLADTGSLPEGKLAQVKAQCERTSRPFEYAFLLDALKDERAQGITIDAARVFFRTEKRPYLIIDAPGHVELLRNLVTGAARAEAALLVIDAKEGVRENSRRHGYLMAMLGLKQLVVLVNKMDLAGYEADAFLRIRDEYEAFLSRLGATPIGFIPVSGRHGDNVASRSTAMAWYQGPTLLEAIDAFLPEPPPRDRPFRMPVQDVYKFTAHGDDRRIVAGTVESGRLSPGDRIVFEPSGKEARVATIEAFAAAAPSSVEAGSAAGVTLAEQVYVARGEIVTRAGEARPCVSTGMRASVFWMGKRPLVPQKDYILKLGTQRVRARIEAIQRVLDVSTLEADEARARVERHEVAECTIRTARPIAFDLVEDLPATGRFVLVDDYEIRGGGIVREALREAARASEPAAPAVPAVERGCVVWLTGLPSSGKTTIAERVVAELRGRGRDVEHLDGDMVRAVFPPAGFTRPERDAHVRWAGFTASRLEAHGVVVVASFVSPYRESRDFVRALCRRFVEVWVSTPLDVCETRDPRGLYARARSGEIDGLTGVSDPYEPPRTPDLELDTSAVGLDEAVARVLGALPEEAE